MPDYRHVAVRLGFVVLVLLSVGLIAQSFVSADELDTSQEIREQAQLPMDERTAIVEPRNSTTVITTQQREHADRAPGEFIAIGPEGTVVYYNRTYHSYWDADPVEGTDSTVLYVAAEHVTSGRCARLKKGCWRNVVETVDLSTGETDRLYAHVSPVRGSGRWHDVDRIDEHRLLVADIDEDRVFVVNHTAGLVTWSWDAQTEFDIESGTSEVSKARGWPGDWTHVNDVEVLGNGTYMASLRNQDQVVFLDRDTGLLPERTLGEDGAHETLYEQHNPDYIPQAQGGPAVVVSDSENNRVIEYQRTDGEWRQTWTWSDARMQWPRDADRLPNGNTLVTDTHGGRILEVDAAGDVVWTVDVIAPYEAERFETGDESTGGPSAESAGLESQTASTESGNQSPVHKVSGAIWGVVGRFVPSIVLNGILYVLPAWMGLRDVFALLVLGGTVSVWGVTEFWWSPWTVRSQWPFDVDSLRWPVSLVRDEDP